MLRAELGHCGLWGKTESKKKNFFCVRTAQPNVAGLVPFRKPQRARPVSRPSALGPATSPGRLSDCPLVLAVNRYLFYNYAFCCLRIAIGLRLRIVLICNFLCVCVRDGAIFSIPDQIHAHFRSAIKKKREQKFD